MNYACDQGCEDMDWWWSDDGRNYYWTCDMQAEVLTHNFCSDHCNYYFSDYSTGRYNKCRNKARIPARNDKEDHGNWFRCARRNRDDFNSRKEGLR